MFCRVGTRIFTLYPTTWYYYPTTWYHVFPLGLKSIRNLFINLIEPTARKSSTYLLLLFVLPTTHECGYCTIPSLIRT